MNLNALQIITLFSSFLLFMLGSIFLFYHHKRKISNYILSAYMFSNTVLLGNFFAEITFPRYIHKFPVIDHIGMHCYLLLAPFLFLYIISLCKKDFRFSLKIILHFAPYMLVTGTAILICIFANSSGPKFAKIWYIFSVINNLVLYFQIGTYIVFSFIELKRYRSQLKELYSNLIRIDLQWINLVLYFLILMWLTDMSDNYLNMFHLVKPGITYYLLIQSVSADLLLCISLIYKGMQQTSFTSGIASAAKYSQTNLDNSAYEEYRNRLTLFIEKEKPFLVPDLNLDNLAEKMKIPPKHLSQTINFCFKQNFNNYINRYRVNEAKQLMEMDKKGKKTFFEILFEAGFNSKSVFNESFKKHTGTTPKEFRKKIKII